MECIVTAALREHPAPAFSHSSLTVDRMHTCKVSQNLDDV